MDSRRAYFERELARRGIDVRTLGAPAAQSQLESIEENLSLHFPTALRQLYESFDGLRAAGNIAFLWPLLGQNSLLDFNSFVRKENWAPSWISKVVFFGNDGYGGYWGLDVGNPDQVIVWEPFDGEAFTAAGPTILDVWERRQAEYDRDTGGKITHE